MSFQDGKQGETPIMELNEFVANCQRVVKNKNGAKEVLTLMQLLMADLSKFQSFMKSLRHKSVFPDPILFQSPDLFIFNYCQIPGNQGPAHTHGVWAVIGVYEGQEINIYYERIGKKLKKVGREILTPGKIAPMEDDAIHSVSNPLDQPSFALHVYGGDLLAVARSMWNPWTMEELPFEINQFLTYSLTMMQQGNVSNMESRP